MKFLGEKARKAPAAPLVPADRPRANDAGGDDADGDAGDRRSCGKFIPGRRCGQNGKVFLINHLKKLSLVSQEYLELILKLRN